MVLFQHLKHNEKKSLKSASVKRKKKNLFLFLIKTKTNIQLHHNRHRFKKRGWRRKASLFNICVKNKQKQKVYRFYRAIFFRSKKASQPVLSSAASCYASYWACERVKLSFSLCCWAVWLSSCLVYILTVSYAARACGTASSSFSQLVLKLSKFVFSSFSRRRRRLGTSPENFKQISTLTPASRGSLNKYYSHADKPLSVGGALYSVQTESAVK